MGWGLPHPATQGPKQTPAHAHPTLLPTQPLTGGHVPRAVMPEHGCHGKPYPPLGRHGAGKHQPQLQRITNHILRPNPLVGWGGFLVYAPSTRGRTTPMQPTPHRLLQASWVLTPQQGFWLFLRFILSMANQTSNPPPTHRSEERRVGKETRD